MRRALVFVVLVPLGGCATVRAAVEQVAAATVAFADSAGAPRGTGVIWQEPNGLVHVELQLVALPPGMHGFHFHAVGRCEGSFASAGPHFNPSNLRHGLSSVDGPHAGDMPNFTVGSNGAARVDVTTDRISLTSGPTNVFDDDGTALVIHAGPDDQISDPSGNSGGRIACGVVRRR